MSASQDGKLIVWDSYSTNKVRKIISYTHLYFSTFSCLLMLLACLSIFQLSLALPFYYSFSLLQTFSLYCYIVEISSDQNSEMFYKAKLPLNCTLRVLICSRYTLSRCGRPGSWRVRTPPLARTWRAGVWTTCAPSTPWKHVKETYASPGSCRDTRGKLILGTKDKAQLFWWIS